MLIIILWVLYFYLVNKMKFGKVKEFIQGETMQIELKLRYFSFLVLPVKDTQK